MWPAPPLPSRKPRGAVASPYTAVVEVLVVLWTFGSGSGRKMSDSEWNRRSRGSETGYT